MNKATIYIPDPNESHEGLPEIVWEDEKKLFEALSKDYSVSVEWGKGAYNLHFQVEGEEKINITNSIKVAIWNLNHGYISKLYVLKTDRGTLLRFDGVPLVSFSTNGTKGVNWNLYQLTKDNTDMTPGGSTHVQNAHDLYKNLFL